MNTEIDRRLRGSWVVAAATGVLLWRAAAFTWPSALVDIPHGLRLPLALLGVVFLASGVGAWWARPGRWTVLFLVYGLCGGVHWGGAIGAANPGLGTSLFFVYLAITALGDAALLHLALVYPHAGPLARTWRVALYAPAGFGLVLVPVAGFAPPTVLEPVAGVVLLAANLFSLLGGGYVPRPIGHRRSRRASRRASATHRDRHGHGERGRAARRGQRIARGARGLESGRRRHPHCARFGAGIAVGAAGGRGASRLRSGSGTGPRSRSSSPGGACTTACARTSRAIGGRS